MDKKIDKMISYFKKKDETIKTLAELLLELQTYNKLVWMKK
jgi:hypothetical protein